MIGLMRNRLTVLLFAVVLVALPLFAGTSQPNASKRQQELIDELVDVMHMDRLVMQSVDAMLEEMLKSLSADAPDPVESKALADHFRELIRQQIDFKAFTRDVMTQTYPKYFNDEDLEQIVAFYRSPTGQKMLASMPALMRDGARLGQEGLGSKMESIVKQMLEEREKQRPWERTMRDLRTIATAVEAYASDNDDTYPRAADYATLVKDLEDDDLPQKDVWGNSYAYVVSADAKHYRVISSGSDGNFEWDSRRIADAKTPGLRYSERSEDDLIYADGSFVQLPKASKPKEPAKKE